MEEVTVLLPLYNESIKFVKEALDSILNQTFSEIKIYITLDNPQNYLLEEYIRKQQMNDHRIKFSVNEKNLGLAATLNKMISTVDTKYIARMDADDISYNKRLKEQFRFMQEHPDVDLCGCNAIYIDQEGKKLKKNEWIPQQHNTIQTCLEFKNCMFHPTYFAKKTIMEQVQYRETLQYAQDYDFLCRCIELGYILANLNQYLLYYRIGKVSELKLLKQSMTAYYIKKYYQERRLCEKNGIAEEIEKDMERSGKERLLCNVSVRKTIREIKNYLIKGKILEAIKYTGYLLKPHKYKIDLWKGNKKYKKFMKKHFGF